MSGLKIVLRGKLRMNQVLYRKYRPKTFSEMVGQDHVKRVLLNAIREDKVSHAYIFSGPRGTGKTSCARILAKSLNCLNPENGEPCNECENCLEIDSGNFMDVIEMDAASNRGIDEIRKIRDRVSYLPAKGKFKVYIVDEFHMLTREAFNALLKTLEEPPPHVLFILATTNIEKVPDTILSRCQILDFKLIPENLIFNHLKNISEKENIDIDEKALKLIAERASGSLRDSLAILEQIQRYSSGKITQAHVREVLGVVPRELILDFIDAIFERDYNELFQISERLTKENRSLENFIIDSMETILNILKTNDDIYERSNDDLIELLSDLSRLLRDIKYTEEKTLIFEIGILSISKKFSESSKRSDILQKPRKQDKNSEDIVRSSITTGENYSVKTNNDRIEGIEELKDYLAKEGDMDLWASLVFSRISEHEDNIILEYPKDKKLHFEIVQEKLEQLRSLYKMITNKEKNFSPVYLDEDFFDLPEDSIKILKKVLSIFPGKVKIEKRRD